MGRLFKIEPTECGWSLLEEKYTDLYVKERIDPQVPAKGMAWRCVSSFKFKWQAKKMAKHLCKPKEFVRY